MRDWDQERTAASDPQAAVWKTMRLGALVIILLLSVCLLWKPTQMHVPPELIGEWRTSDPNYADRGMYIDQTTISFETGEGQVSVGFINSIKLAIENNQQLYTVKYSLDGTSSQASFFYEGVNPKTIRFKNQPAVWVKSQSSD